MSVLKKTMTRRARRVGPFALAVVAVLANVAAASPSRTPHNAPTGDAATIALYTRVVARMNALSHVVQVTHGDTWFGYSPTGWELNWGSAKAVYPFQIAVDDTSVVRMSKGVTSWTMDTYATPCQKTTTCHSKIEPLRIYASSSGDYWSLASGKAQSVSCWYRAVGAESWMTTDFTVGTPLWYAGSAPYSTSPNYKPMVKVGNLITVTSTYQYKSSHRGVVEVDTINATTLRFTKSAVTVFKGTGANEAAYSYTIKIIVPATVPAAPRLNLCR